MDLIKGGVFLSNALTYYNNQIDNKNKKLKKLNKIILQLSVLRLIIFILGILSAFYFYKNENILAVVFTLTFFLLLFIIVAYFHNEKIIDKEETLIYLEINKKGVSRIEGNFKDFKDNGEEFLDEKHAFINDLDVFGRNSLFQMINSTRTKFGRQKLSEILMLKNLPTKEDILERQEAVEELSKKIEWRQRLEVKSAIKNSANKSIEDLLAWANSEVKLRSSLKIVPYFFVSITFVLIILTILKVVPFAYLLLNLIINYAVVKSLTKDLQEVILLFDNHKKDIEAYTNLLELIEKENFKSKLLLRLKDKLTNDTKKSTYNEMKTLKNLVDWLGDSYKNAYYLILNVLFFIDAFILRNIENWKKENGKYFEEWLNAMGEIEALCSISNISFDFEKWTYPEISEGKEVEGIEIAHPILGSKAVSNSFRLNNNLKVALITGSNMSGKSTFLRTVGLNLLLSYIGAKTYSKSFRSGIFNIYTCMRTSDNLEESISSFYAEILRIKILIDAAKRGERVFFLLDEIFKGTNSKDRHEGARVLINQLVENGSIGLVSTHDLELCDLEETKDWIKNYNFQEYYKDDKIHFDYKLREGRSKTQNAIHLMKLAGIEFKEF